MGVGFSFGVIYRIPCSACDQGHEERFVIPQGGEVPRPRLPFGWIVANGRAFCPKHQCELYVDHKPVRL